MGSKRDLPQCSVACFNCRSKKARCSGSKPCSNCVTHERVCTFPDSEPRHRQHKRKAQEVDDRIARLESLLSKQQHSQEQRPVDSDDSVSAYPNETSPAVAPSMEITFANNDVHQRSVLTDTGASDISIDEDVVLNNQPQQSTNVIGTGQSISINGQSTTSWNSRVDHASATYSDSQLSILGTTILSPGMIPGHDAWSQSYHTSALNMHGADASLDVGTDDVATWSDSVIPQEDEHPEHHGNTSFLSICYKSGIDWISQRTGSYDFVTSAQSFANTVSRGLKLDHISRSQMTPEPSPENVRRWTTVFFEESFEQSIGFVPRKWFENRLRFTLADDRQVRSDPGWYALRNTVYAIGSRIEISSDFSPASYSAARDTSLMYFDNAMSVHSELLYTRTDATAVEALALMAFFAEGLSSPALEYILLSNATRLAQSKGFHLRNYNGMVMSEEDREHRSWIWWCIYILDKHIASRSARPSCISDQDMNLPIPSCPRRGTHASLDFFVSAIKHAQISSLASQKLSSGRLLTMPMSDVLNSIKDLDKELRDWWGSLHPVFRSRPTSRMFKAHPDITLMQWTYLYYHYHGTLCAVHNVVAYPWLRTALNSAQQPDIMTQVLQSSQAVADAARAIALASQQSEVNAASHVWQVFYFPILSQISLFLNILQTPEKETAVSDLALMEVIVGHFSSLQYATNNAFNISFAKDLTKIACNFYHRGRDGATTDLNMSHVPGRDAPSYPLFNELERDPLFADLGNVEWPFQFPALNDLTFGL